MPRQHERVVLPPLFHHLGGNVVPLVVGRVAAKPPRIAFQQHRRRRFFHRVDRLANRRVDGPRIETVDRAAVDAVADRAVRKPPAVVLHGRRRGEGVMIVLDDEQHRHLVYRSDVQRLVELAGARAAVADDRQAEHLFAVVTSCPRSAHDHAQHLAQVADHGEPPCGRVAVVAIAFAGVCRAVLVGHVLADELKRRRAQQQVADEVAVQERDDVFARPQRHGHAQRGGLVARAAGDRALDVSFLEQFQEALFQTTGEEHLSR